MNVDEMEKIEPRQDGAYLADVLVDGENCEEISAGNSWIFVQTLIPLFCEGSCDMDIPPHVINQGSYFLIYNNIAYPTEEFEEVGSWHDAQWIMSNFKPYW